MLPISDEARYRSVVYIHMRGESSRFASWWSNKSRSFVICITALKNSWYGSVQWSDFSERRNPCESFRVTVLSDAAHVGHDVFLIPGPRSYLSLSRYSERSLRTARHFTNKHKDKAHIVHTISSFAVSTACPNLLLARYIYDIIWCYPRNETHLTSRILFIIRNFQFLFAIRSLRISLPSLFLSPSLSLSLALFCFSRV